MWIIRDFAPFLYFFFLYASKVYKTHFLFVFFLTNLITHHPHNLPMYMNIFKCILVHFGWFWNILEYFGSFLNIFYNFEVLRSICVSDFGDDVWLLLVVGNILFKIALKVFKGFGSIWIYIFGRNIRILGEYFELFGAFVIFMGFPVFCVFGTFWLWHLTIIGDRESLFMV